MAAEMPNDIPRRIYIAPTEPPALRALGKTTLLPETMGCDVLSYSYNPFTLVGFQRKELSDFISSIADGRLSKELGQIRDSPLSYAVLLLEGEPIWTNEGVLTSQYGMDLTRKAFRGLLATIQASFGVIVIQTRSISDTSTAITELSEYLSKPSHDTLARRPKQSLKNSWGRATSNAFGSHLLQSFPGIGPNTAEGIMRQFGRVPLKWTVTNKELISVPGIGKKMANSLLEALE